MGEAVCFLRAQKTFHLNIEQKDLIVYLSLAASSIRDRLLSLRISSEECILSSNENDLKIPSSELSLFELAES